MVQACLDVLDTKETPGTISAFTTLQPFPCHSNACARFVGIVLCGLGGGLQYWRDRDDEWAPDIFHHYGFQAVGAGVP